MLASRMLSRLERNWEQIADQVIAQARRLNHTSHYGELDETEIRERAQLVLQDLEAWLLTGDEDTLRRKYEELGKRRCHENLPLERVVYRLQTLERTIVGYLRDYTPIETAVDLHAEIELLTALHSFFGTTVYGVVSGYEYALKEGTAIPAAARSAPVAR
jgi:hypothetical protein